MTRILYLVHRFPYPPNKGDRIRTFNLIKFLSERAQVDVATLADEPVSVSERAGLLKHCGRLHVTPVSRLGRPVGALASLLQGRSLTEGAFSAADLKAVVRRWSRQTQYDAVLASSSGMVPYLHLPELRDVRAVVDLIDVDSQKWFDYAAASSIPKRWLYQIEGRRLRRLERGLPRRASAITLVTENEAELYRRFCAGSGFVPETVHVIGNGVDLDYFAPQPDQQVDQTCVFVGAMDYRPNADGAIWFCRHVWPSIQQQFPDHRFQIVGRRPTTAVRRLASLPGVEVVGTVADVRPYLARCSAAVVPLQIARGVQNKVLEAMAMARAVIATPDALTGLNVQSNEHVLSASTAEEWVTAISGVLSNDALRSELGDAARRYVESHHTWAAQLGAVRDLISPPARTTPASSLPVVERDGLKLKTADKASDRQSAAFTNPVVSGTTP